MEQKFVQRNEFDHVWNQMVSHFGQPERIVGVPLLAAGTD